VNAEQADYVCDGNDDQVQIQQAIDSLPSEGGMIELLGGVFNFSDDLEITKSNVTIRGTGNSTILKHLPTEWVALTADELVGSATITVEDIAQFHVGQLIGVSDDQLNPPPVPGEPYAYYNGGLDRGLENPMSVAENARAAPAWVMIKAYGKTDIELRDFAIDCSRYNIARIYTGYCHYPGYVSPPPTILDKVHHGEEPTSAIYMDYAHNSKFRNLYLHDITMSGIFLIDSNYVLVEENTIRNFGLKGYVDCFGDYTRIIGNVVENSVNEDGINVYSGAAHYTIVSNNIVKNCPRGNILINQARKAVVTGNITTGGGVGIFVCTQEAAVTGNYVESTPTGISIYTLSTYWGNPSSEYPITVMANSLKDCGVGFNVHEASNIIISANAVSGITGGGEVVSKAAGSRDRFIISDNQFLNSSSEYPAIWLGGDNHFIFGNKIKNFEKGVWLEPTAEGNIIERNEFIDVSEHLIDEGQGNMIDIPGLAGDINNDNYVDFKDLALMATNWSKYKYD